MKNLRLTWNPSINLFAIVFPLSVIITLTAIMFGHGSTRPVTQKVLIGCAVALLFFGVLYVRFLWQLYTLKLKLTPGHFGIRVPTFGSREQTEILESSGTPFPFYDTLFELPYDALEEGIELKIKDIVVRKSTLKRKVSLKIKLMLTKEQIVKLFHYVRSANGSYYNLLLKRPIHAIIKECFAELPDEQNDSEALAKRKVSEKVLKLLADRGLDLEPSNVSIA